MKSYIKELLPQPKMLMVASCKLKVYSKLLNILGRRAVLSPERLVQVARNESIGSEATFNFSLEAERLFGQDREVTKEVETSTGAWRISLSDQEPEVDLIVFEKATTVELPEILSVQFLISRAKVGIGLRTLRAMTETEAMLFSDDPDRNTDLIRRNKLSFSGINAVKVEEDFEINPRLLRFAPTPRSPEHVAQILAGSTALFRTIE